MKKRMSSKIDPEQDFINLLFDFNRLIDDNSVYKSVIGKQNISLAEMLVVLVQGVLDVAILVDKQQARDIIFSCQTNAIVNELNVIYFNRYKQHMTADYITFLKNGITQLMRNSFVPDALIMRIKMYHLNYAKYKRLSLKNYERGFIVIPRLLVNRYLEFIKRRENQSNDIVLTAEEKDDVLNRFNQSAAEMFAQYQQQTLPLYNKEIRRFMPLAIGFLLLACMVYLTVAEQANIANILLSAACLFSLISGVMYFSQPYQPRVLTPTETKQLTKQYRQLYNTYLCHVTLGNFVLLRSEREVLNNSNVPLADKALLLQFGHSNWQNSKSNSGLIRSPNKPNLVFPAQTLAPQLLESRMPANIDSPVGFFKRLKPRKDDNKNSAPSFVASSSVTPRMDQLPTDYLLYSDATHGAMYVIKPVKKFPTVTQTLKTKFPERVIGSVVKRGEFNGIKRVQNNYEYKPTGSLRFIFSETGKTERVPMSDGTFREAPVLKCTQTGRK